MDVGGVWMIANVEEDIEAEKKEEDIEVEKSEEDKNRVEKKEGCDRGDVNNANIDERMNNINIDKQVRSQTTRYENEKIVMATRWMRKKDKMAKHCDNGIKFVMKPGSRYDALADEEDIEDGVDIEDVVDIMKVEVVTGMEQIAVGSGAGNVWWKSKHKRGGYRGLIRR